MFAFKATITSPPRSVSCDSTLQDSRNMRFAELALFQKLNISSWLRASGAQSTMVERSDGFIGRAPRKLGEPNSEFLKGVFGGILLVSMPSAS